MSTPTLADTQTIRTHALRSVGGRLDLARQLARIFLSESEMQMAAIRKSIDEGDKALLELNAHSLKSSLVLFGADSTADWALQLEMMGRDGDLTLASTTFEKLSSELAQLKPTFFKLAEEAEG